MAAIGLQVVHVQDPNIYDRLDAIAYLLTDRARTRVRHRRELNQEIQEQTRAARDGYHQGRDEQAELDRGQW